MSDHTRVGILDLPPELLNKCLATLTFSSLQQVRQTCQSLHRAVQFIHDNEPSVEIVSRERSPLLMERTDLLTNYDQHFRHGNACLFSVWVRDNTYVRAANRLQAPQTTLWTVDTAVLFPQIPVAAVHLDSQSSVRPAQNLRAIHPRNTGPLRVSYTNITSLDHMFGGAGLCNVTELWLHSCIVHFSLDEVIDFFPGCDKFRFTLSHFDNVRMRIHHLELWGKQGVKEPSTADTSRHAFSHVCCEVSDRLQPWTHACTHVAVRQLLVTDHFRGIFPNATHLTLNRTQIFGSIPCVGITKLTVRGYAHLSANFYPRLGELFPDLTCLTVHTSALWDLTLAPFPRLQQLCVFVQGPWRTHVQTIVGQDALIDFQQKYLEHKLPSSVWTRVCQHLDFDSLSAAAQTCRDLRTIVSRLKQDPLPWYPNHLRPCATRLRPLDAHLWLVENAPRDTPSSSTTSIPQVEASDATPTPVETQHGESTRMKRKQWNGFPTVLGDSIQEHATGICKVNTWTNPWNNGTSVRYMSCAQAAALPELFQTRFGNQFAFAVQIRRGDMERDIQTVLQRNYLIDSLDVDSKTPSLAFSLKPRKVSLFDFKIRSPKMHQVMFELNTPLELHLENCDISHAALLWMTNILNHKRINLTLSHCRYQKDSHKTHPVVFHHVSIVPVLCRRQLITQVEAGASRPVDFEWMYSVHIDGNHEDISHTCSIVEQVCSFRMVHLRLHHCKDVLMVTQCPTVEWLEIVDGDIFLQYDWSRVTKINLVQGSITPWTRLPNLKELYVDGKRDVRDPIHISLSHMVRVVLHQPAHLPPILLHDRDTRAVSEVRDWEQESQMPPAKKRRL